MHQGSNRSAAIRVRDKYVAGLPSATEHPILAAIGVALGLLLDSAQLVFLPETVQQHLAT